MQGNRRKLLQMLAAGAAFYGPWKVNRVWAQSGKKKPLTIGLTMDASGQYGASAAAASGNWRCSSEWPGNSTPG